jgi:negative regulator of sigma E activity
MAECRQMTDLISRYIDGELDEPEKRELERHLEQCPSCRSVLSAYKNIAAAAAESLVEPPEDFTDNVMAAVKKLSDRNNANPGRKKTIRNAVITFAAAAACVALALIAAPLLGRSGGTRDMAASAPSSAPAADYELMTQESAPESGTYGSAKTDGSYSAAGGAADDENSVGTAPADQAPMICATGAGEEQDGTAAAPSPEPTPAPSPEQPAELRADSELLKTYSAVFYFDGRLPEVLVGLDSTKTDDGTLRIIIQADTADALLADGYAGIAGNPDAETALVVYTPPES